jgi:hypothetical protein
MAKLYRSHHRDQFMSSLTATCRYPDVFKKKSPVKVQEWEIPTSLMKKGILPVLTGLQRHPSGELKRAPLVFYVPGSFVNLDESQPRRWLAEFTSLGYHTIIFPNPWGTQFVKQIPEGKLGSIEFESAVLYDVLQKTHQKIKEQGGLSGPVRIAGVSSGGFFCAVIAAIDAQREDSILNTDATIMSPPFHMGRALDRLDSLIDETREPYQDMYTLRTYWKYKTLCKLDPDKEMEQGHLKDAMGIAVFEGFYEHLVDSVKAYDKAKGIDSIPRGFFNWLNPKYRKWRKKFTFETYFNEYNPEAKEVIKGEKGHLYFWIGKAYQAGFSSFRILTTTDDFLNDSSLWSGFDQNPLRLAMGSRYGTLGNPALWERITQDVVVLKNGGHYGFRGSPWFQKFIRLGFSRSDTDLLRVHQYSELYSDLQ